MTNAMLKRLGSALAALVLAAGCAANPPRDTGMHGHPGVAAAIVNATAVNEQERFGIQPESLRLTGAGLLIDFRYKVLDPARAAHVVNRDIKPYVEDKATGHRFQVPHAQKIGTLRHMGGKLQAGRQYSMLFANPGRTIKSGAKVAVVVGDYRLDDVAVE